MLIKSKCASKFELETVYSLDEALKLYALWEMENDVESAKNKEMSDKIKRK